MDDASANSLGRPDSTELQSEEEREEQFMTTGWTTLRRRCQLILTEVRFFKRALTPVLTLLFFIGWLGTALAAFLIVTDVKIPQGIQEWPSWFQIDCVPYALAAMYLGRKSNAILPQ